MKGIHISMLAFVLILQGGWSSPEGKSYDTKVVKTVVIDPGHGGHDSGCLGSSAQEKHIVLDIALKLSKYIKKRHPDVKVILTRKTDKFVELHKRAEIANDNNADLFISVHANASPSSQAYGTETFVMGLHKSKDNLRVAQRENSVILKEDNYKEEYNNFNPNSPEAYIMFSMYQSAYLEQSIEFASYVEEQFKESERRSRGVKQAGFLVLYRTSMPSVLIETGFLTNHKEEVYLKTEKGKKETAKSILESFTKFKNRMETVAEKDNSTPTDEGVVFKVQVGATSKPVDLEKEPYRKLNEVEARKDGNGMYKYLAGSFKTANEAVSHRDKLRKDGFKGAFVVAYKNGERIPFEKAISLTQK